MNPIVVRLLRARARTDPPDAGSPRQRRRRETHHTSAAPTSRDLILLLLKPNTLASTRASYRQDANSA